MNVLLPMNYHAFTEASMSRFARIMMLWHPPRPNSNSLVNVPTSDLMFSGRRLSVWVLGGSPVKLDLLCPVPYDVSLCHTACRPGCMAWLVNQDRRSVYFYGPKKHISISILWGHPYLIGLPFKGVYMGYPHPYFCLCAFGGPYL